MEGHNNSADFRAIVVGAESETFISPATFLFQRIAVNYAVCQDLYEAVLELAGNPARRGIVIGRLEHLSRENGRLFEKAAKRGWVCCCLAKKISRGSRTQAIRAMKSGAIVVNNHSQLEDVVMRIMGSNPETSSGANNVGFDNGD